ncbi:hypothetical protein [Arthrobacter sp. NicSoilB8]|uniref:hypothetical protein n=1 Tax=Arthrobacter sp. NicSoilB8 TaxID=2830998 RepID=UPI001CC5B8C0|nr:hypothetical protein [Arthrobacter sp. NicSoilB8]
MNRGQRGKLAMATAALGIGLLSLTGCGYINPQQTSEQYSASDGTRTDLGALQLRNFIIVSDGENKPGRVIGAVYNTSSKDVVLTIKGAEGSQTQVPVKQKSYTMLNDSTEPATLSITGAKPGAMAEVTISEDGANKNAKFMVPVLDGTIVDYKTYLPTPEPTASSTATSTETATPAATGTPTPSSTAGH